LAGKVATSVVKYELLLLVHKHTRFSLQVATLYNVRGLGLENPEALARDATRYQKAQELMKVQRMKYEKRDKSYRAEFRALMAL